MTCVRRKWLVLSRPANEPVSYAFLMSNMEGESG